MPRFRPDGFVRRNSHDQPPAGEAPRTYQDQKTEAERGIILAALERHGWHVTKTAEALGLADHASLLKIMRRLDIRRP